jgi:peptide-methionine (R)-S-oxide reductase
MRRRLFNIGLASAILTAGSHAVGEASDMAEGFFGRLSGRGASSKSEKRFEVELSDEEWRRRLTPPQYHVLREHGTERAGSSPLDKQYGAGVYNCAGCGQPLFASETKFNSGTGWPSFWAPLDNAVETDTDRSFFMVRNEVHCRHCGGHLGHVFDDGPQPTGQRYCMNGVSLDFRPGDTPAASGQAKPEKS